MAQVSKSLGEVSKSLQRSRGRGARGGPAILPSVRAHGAVRELVFSGGTGLFALSPNDGAASGASGGGGGGDGDGAPGSTLEVVVQLRKIGVEHPLAPSPLPHGCE